MSNTEPAELGEGHSPAAWTAVVIMLIGFAAGTLCFWFDLAVGVWISAAVVIVGLVAGAVMSKAGYGVNGPKFVPKHHEE
ncbi:hypothetical protein Csp2054_09995 [Curtobacterium sp. 'Ferrero']|uniref:DUF6704 family protein n=1 Tax=Curtobacterium sp. 'Ferrero' TaxID=2033654 RepID=UPI000BC8F350|nr:DUF6704 family protein [Curtobacterium sp. 'Ferrero']PCN47928.1 hypothetical protein Csp2054_09995 [Curtobacterium sp. 'Ferrero']